MNVDHLYIHIPFCDSKCDYCAFYSETASTKELKQTFLQKLSDDLSKQSAELQNLKTIFIGGGTPSALSSTELEQLFNHISRWVNLNTVSEFTVENNPENLNSEKIALYSKFHVNRISIGVQSFNPQLRRIIGRKASPQNIEEVITQLIKHGITNINLDLIYGIPEQTASDFLNDLSHAVRLPISHISAYSLTIEEGVRLATNKTVVNDHEAVEMQLKGIDYLKENGFNRYEISNYCRDGKKCLHNDGIWHGETYLGVGPTAASFNGTHRFQQPALTHWLADSPPVEDVIPSKARAREIFVIGLRTLEGWNIKRFKKVSGYLPTQLYRNELQSLITDQFLEVEANRIQPTPKGLLYADHIAVSLI